MTTNAPVLKVENIKKRFDDIPVLKGVSLEMFPGDIKVVIGPSGGGKSTLLHCINFLVKMDEGRIYFKGTEVSHSRKREVNRYRQKVGMIFQDFNLFDHLDAINNVAIGLVRVRKLSKRKALGRAETELEKMGLSDHLKKYPAELSGGQKQRVSIARALAMDPEVMLLDEPTSALDPELIGEVHEAIQVLASGGMTMLLVTHELGFAGSLADEILFIENGIVLEKGPPKKILTGATHDRTSQFCAKISQLHNGSH